MKNMDPPILSQTNSSDYYEEDDSAFLHALDTAVLPGDNTPNDARDEFSQESSQPEPPPPSHPSLKRRRLEAFEERGKRARAEDDEDIYGASHFGGWGEYMRRKRAKLQIQNQELEEPQENGSNDAKIFRGLSIYINGWTQPSVQDLRKLIIKHGGAFQPYLDKKSLVTHIIACSLTPAKIRDFKNMKVVRPEWLVESDKAGVLLPWQDFVFVPNQGPQSIHPSQKQQIRLDGFQTPPSTPRKPTLGTRAKIAAEAPPPPTAEPVVPTKPPAAPLQSVTTSRFPAIDQPKDTKEAHLYATHDSNPIAARVMANPQWRKAHTSIAPDFVEGFYKNSRLHHLSTWKAELKNLVQEAQERAETPGGMQLVGRVASEIPGITEGVSMRGAELVMKSPSRAKGKGKEKAVDDRVIMHCDFDCFFVSAGLLTRGHLKGKPVVVCHSQGGQGGVASTSEIASSSYEARSFGVKNGMSLQRARRLCPGLITIPYEFERYKQLSLKFYTILMPYADDLQAVSVDEALMDVTSLVTQLRSQSSYDPSIDPAKDFAETIRAQIRQATGCEISIGISHNILLARLATRRAKPAGSYHLVPDDLQEFLAPLCIADLHGFGTSTMQKAQEKLGATKLGELADKSKSALCDALGKSTGETLYNAIRGIDDKKLESDKPRKSVSCEINYGIRFEDNDQAQTFVYQMATEVAKRLDDIGMLGRCITLKIMKRDPTSPVEPPKFLGHGACDLYNKQMALIGSGGRATSDSRVIGEHAWRLLRSFNFDPKELRGIGIQIQKLESPSSGAKPSPQGQAMLPFRRPHSPVKFAPVPAWNPKRPVVVSKPLQPVDPPQPDTRASESPSKPSIDLPSFSQVDMEVFEALPPDVREEFEAEYQRRSAPLPTTGPPPLAAQAGKKVFPNNNRPFKPPNFKRIARQLRPQNGRATFSAKKFLEDAGILKRKKGGLAGAAKISDAALRELNIDPAVFRALPPPLQHEQLTMLRIIKERGAIPSPPSRRKVLKPRRKKPIPAHLLWRAPPPRARYVAPPILRLQGKGKKEKVPFTDTDDIQKALEGWVNVYQRWPPKEKDVEFFTKYLEQAVDGRTFSDVSVQRAVAVMKWWLVLLRRHWGGSEYVDDEDCVDPSQGDPVGEAWWKAFREVKAKMDVVACRKFGGRLSLK